MTLTIRPTADGVHITRSRYRGIARPHEVLEMAIALHGNRWIHMRWL